MWFTLPYFQPDECFQDLIPYQTQTVKIILANSCGEGGGAFWRKKGDFVVREQEGACRLNLFQSHTIWTRSSMLLVDRAERTKEATFYD